MNFFRACITTSNTGVLSSSRNNSESEKVVTQSYNDKDKIHIRPNVNKRNNQKHNKQNKNDFLDDDINIDRNNDEKDNKKQQQLKRGQHGKMKKIKEKYKDQDEEERKLIMEVLQSAGSGKETKKNKKNSKKDNESNKNAKKKGVGKPQIQPRPVKQAPSGDSNETEEPEILAQANVDMLDSLTGCPVPEDELLFAVPVIAPYNTLQSYK